MKKQRLLLIIVSLCLVETASAHSVTVGGMNIRYGHDAVPVAMGQIFQHWRSELRAKQETHLVLVRELGRPHIRLVQSAPSLPTLIAQQ